MAVVLLLASGCKLSSGPPRQHPCMEKVVGLESSHSQDVVRCEHPDHRAEVKEVKDGNFIVKIVITCRCTQEPQ